MKYNPRQRSLVSSQMDVVQAATIKSSKRTQKRKLRGIDTKLERMLTMFSKFIAWCWFCWGVFSIGVFIHWWHTGTFLLHGLL
jgi:hypothetical protein